MLEISELACVRGERTLFSRLNCSLDKGSLLRVAGPNGSGKTSLLRILCGLAAPASGEVRWAGEPIRRMREEYSRQLVYLGHAHAVKDELTARENLMVACALGGMSPTNDAQAAALSRLGVEDCAELPVRFLSQGQRRRVALARLVLSAGALLWVLDEPFTALDTAAIGIVQHLIGGHVSDGGMVVLATHQDVMIPGASAQAIELGRSKGDAC